MYEINSSCLNNSKNNQINTQPHTSQVGKGKGVGSVRRGERGSKGLRRVGKR